MSGSEARLRVAVCIASHRRPEGLAALLGSLDAQVFAGPAPEVEIVVADNDPDGSGRRVCAALRRRLDTPLRCLVEKRPGIPQARNASLGPVLGRVDWIAFVDDDERVGPGWLDALLRTQRETGADVVVGPVVPRYAEVPPAWLQQAGFYVYPRHADGAALATAWVGNTLVRESLLAARQPPFDERMATGEDTELFFRLVRDGARIAWCDAAVVHETIGPEKATLAAVLRRGLREGVAQARLERLHGLRSAAVAVGIGLARLVEGLFVALFPAPIGAACRARGAKGAAFGVGRCLESWASRGRTQ